MQASYVYDPSGRYLAGTGSLLSANAMSFLSKPWVAFLASSTTSGLYYYGYRFYDLHLQRWMKSNLLMEMAGANLYSFVLNASFRYVDRFGLSVDESNLWLLFQTPFECGQALFEL